MSTTEYAAPASGSGDKLPLAELKGSLLRIDVHELKNGMQTSFGPADAVACTVAVLDGPRKADVFSDALVFPKVLASQLRPSLGKVVLGRLGQGQAKPGQSAPWMLTAPTTDDIEVARKYDAHVAKQAAEQAEPF